VTPADWLTHLPGPPAALIGLGWWVWLIGAVFFREPRRDRKRRERVDDIAEGIARSSHKARGPNAA
jgi:hypothetical protein